MGKKGKSLTMKELQKKVGVNKQGSQKQNRKNAATGAKRGRGKVEERPTVEAETKLVHPKSRRAKQLMRSITNDHKKAQHRLLLDTVQRLKSSKVKWFKEYSESEEHRADFQDVKCIQKPLLVEMTRTYLQRHDKELHELKEKRAGTSHYRVSFASGREKELSQLRSEEVAQAQGELLEVPFLTSKAGLKGLREWDGTLETLYTIPFTPIKVEEVPLDEPSFSIGEVSFSRAAALKRKHAERRVRYRTKSKKLIDSEKSKAQRVSVQATAVQSKRSALLAAKRGTADGAAEAAEEGGDAVVKAKKAAPRKKVAKDAEASGKAKKRTEALAAASGATGFSFSVAPEAGQEGSS